MDLLTSYNSDDESENITETTSLHMSNRLSAAPTVISSALIKTKMIKNPEANQIVNSNTTVDVMYAPHVGPANPFGNNYVGGHMHKSGMGMIEETFVEDVAFNNCYQNYLVSDFKDQQNESMKPKLKKQKLSKAEALMKYVDPSLLYDENTSNTPWVTEPVESERERNLSVGQALKLQQQERKNAEHDSNNADAVGKDKNMHVIDPDEEDEKWEKVNERKLGSLLPPRPSRGSVAADSKTTFHGESEYDYQGRSWCAVPPGVRPNESPLESESFIPKKCIKKYLGHSKGVHAIELFPKTGHLLLSGSMDSTCKIWDVHSNHTVMRTYGGHSEAVRSIHMSNEGSTFLSSGFDRYVRLWDVETGAATATFSNRKMHYQVRFHPHDNNTFICASSDNKLYQWDIRAGTMTQEYNYHLQPCNTLLFYDDGRKFVSTSDDKKILAWEFGIPVPIKYIAEPEMHSVPSLTIHPTNGFFVGQSLDNTIVTYQCGEKLRQMKKKTFRGHNNSGYACQIGFSPNGKFLVSGDGFGKLHFWDFKTTRPYRKLQAHDNGPCMSAVWHPLTPSWVFTCGWDGQIKLWD